MSRSSTSVAASSVGQVGGGEVGEPRRQPRGATGPVLRHAPATGGGRADVHHPPVGLVGSTGREPRGHELLDRLGDAGRGDVLAGRELTQGEWAVTDDGGQRGAEGGSESLGVLLPQEAGQSERRHPEPAGDVHGVGGEGGGRCAGHVPKYTRYLVRETNSSGRAGGSVGRDHPRSGVARAPAP